MATHGITQQHDIQFRHTIANQSCWKKDFLKVYKYIKYILTAANKKGY